MAGTTINSGYVGIGITLASGYTLSNTSTGTITNSAAGVLGTVGGIPNTVVNAGSILGGGTGDGVLLQSGGVVTNEATGTIGGSVAIETSNYAGTVINRGKVTSSDSGIRLDTGGSIDNQAGGTIIAGYRGMQVAGGPGTVTNSGYVSAVSNGIAVFGAGGRVTNQATGTIISGFDGLYLTVGGTATNQGTISAARQGIFMSVGGTVTNSTGGGISGAQSGVVLFGNGSVTNEAGATINGRYLGVFLSGGSSTVTNAGTIGATGPGAIAAIAFDATSTNRLIIEPGAQFNGRVNGGNAIGSTATSSLELALGTGAGTLSGDGGTGLGASGSFAKYVNFADITVDSGATWTLTGNNTIVAGATLTDNGTLINTGSLDASGGSIVVNGSLANTGGITNRIVMNGGARLSNASTGTLTGGIYAAGGADRTVTNAGRITAASGYVISMQSGGTVSNVYGGTISGAQGVSLAGTAIVDNQGRILATGQNGVRLSGGGSVFNASSGKITGLDIGVHIFGGTSTVTNAGTIGASGPGITLAVQFDAGVTNRLIVDPGAVFIGAVDGGNAIGGAFISTLELASGASAGALSGIGSQYTGFGAVAIDAGASWTLSGTNTIAAGATLTNNGTLTNSGSLNAIGVFIDNASLVNSGGLNTTLVMTGGAGLSNSTAGKLYGAIYAAATGADRTITNAGTITNTSDIPVINFQSGGTIGNAVGATIAGIRAIDISGAASIGNQGLILATGGPGSNGSAIIVRIGGATVSNAAGATISGQFYGVVLGAGTGIVTNSGSIHAGAEVGVALNAGGTVSNMSGGTITGHYDGVKFHAVAGTFTNQGYVAAEAGSGAASDKGGSVTNLSGGSIVGQGAGVVISGAAGTVSNNGGISGGASSIGVALGSGGTITNDTSGRINGYGAVQVTGGAGTVINRGSIIASGPRAVTLAAGYANLVSVAPGAAFTGTVDGGNTIGASTASTLELGSAATTGTLTGLGSKYIDFARIIVDSGASWSLSGANTIGAGVTLTINSASLNAAGTLVNNGSILLDPSTLSVGGLGGTGSVTIGAGGAVSVQGAVASGQTIDFASASGVLAIAAPGADDGTIAGFASGDTIALLGVGNVISTDLINGDTLEIGLSAGEPIDLKMSGGFAGQFFHHALIGSDTFITEDNVPCFLAGTLILTDRGEVVVEALTTADRAITLSGAARPIRWIGFGRALVTPRNRCDVSPVIVRRGALADDVPHHDLSVTRHHAVLVGDVLVPAEHLINGISVRWDDAARVLEYYHVELDTHDVVMANGAPTESFRDDGSHDLFQNRASRPLRSAPDLACRPIVEQGPALERAWRTVAARAGDPPAEWLTGDPGLHMRVDGRHVAPLRVDGEKSRFRIDWARREVCIVSRSCIPRAHGLGQDARRLGVGIVGLTLFYPGGRRVLPLCADELAAGFHDREGDIRWTKGVATLSAGLFGGVSPRVDLEVRLGGTLRYPRELAA